MTENALQTKYLRFINGRALNVIPDITVDLGHGLVNLRIFLVRLAHEGVLGTHRGVVQTLSFCRKYMWFPRIDV